MQTARESRVLHDAHHFKSRTDEEHNQNQQNNRAGDGCALTGETAGAEIVA